MINCFNFQITKDGTIHGINKYTGDPVIFKDKDANLHTLAIGTTGSGKTTALSNIIESAIQRSLPLFYVDGKGDLELANKIALYAKAHGRPFYLFSMVGYSVKYNPLSSGGITPKKDRIIALRTWSEDHYRKIAEGYLQTVFQILETMKISVDLNTLAHYCEPNALALLARERKDSALMEQVKRLNDRRKDIESLIAEIENLTQSEIGHLFDCTKGRVLDLATAFSESAIVYFSLQPLAFPSYAETLGKVIINDIKALAAAQFSTPIKSKLYCIFDEFSVFAGDQIIHLINQGRSAGIHAILSTQSLSDIAKAGGETLVAQILNNCNNYLIQRQNNPSDAETLAKVIGTQDNFEVTSQLMSDQMGSRVGTVRSIKEYVCHPDEIKRLRMGDAILVNKQLFSMQRIMLRSRSLTESGTTCLQ